MESQTAATSHDTSLEIVLADLEGRLGRRGFDPPLLPNEFLLAFSLPRHLLEVVVSLF
jgi:hypothetical protein